MTLVDKNRHRILKFADQFIWENSCEILKDFIEDSTPVFKQLVFIDYNQVFGFLCVLEQHVNIVLVGNFLEWIIVLIVEAWRIPNTVGYVWIFHVAFDFKVTYFISLNTSLLVQHLQLILNKFLVMIWVVKMLVLRILAACLDAWIGYGRIMANEPVWIFGHRFEFTVANFPGVFFVESKQR